LDFGCNFLVFAILAATYDERIPYANRFPQNIVVVVDKEKIANKITVLIPQLSLVETIAPMTNEIRQCEGSIRYKGSSVANFSPSKTER